MRKKLFFDKTVSLHTPMYILIKNGKIREFDGADLTPAIFRGKPITFEIHETNTDFELIKVSKYDRKKQNISANYQIKCNYLFSKFVKDTYIKLDLFDKFKIDYAKKQTVYHKMNFYQKIISFVVFGLLAFFAKEIYQSIPNKENNIEQTHLPKPESTTINQEMNVPKIKADTISTQKIKSESDSLRLE
jgi:hypothetical protein